MKLSVIKMSHTTRLGLAYFTLAFSITGLVFVTVQQNLRMGANDPQIQLAEDIAADLDSGRSPASLSNSEEVDMRTSLAPFIIVTDANKKVVVSTGTLDGRNATPPDGAFDAAKLSPTHQNRITWQPAPGVREAAVIVANKDGYVVAVRSLREVEAREDQAQIYAFVTLGALIVVGLVLIVVIK
jgi:hypothetical protein